MLTLSVSSVTLSLPSPACWQTFSASSICLLLGPNTQVLTQAKSLICLWSYQEFCLSEAQPFACNFPINLFLDYILRLPLAYLSTLHRDHPLFTEGKCRRQGHRNKNPGTSALPLGFKPFPWEAPTSCNPNSSKFWDLMLSCQSDMGRESRFQHSKPIFKSQKLPPKPPGKSWATSMKGK